MDNLLKEPPHHTQQTNPLCDRIQQGELIMHIARISVTPMSAHRPNVEAVSISETSVNFYEITWHNMQIVLKFYLI
jgi:hypothetical protein